jgi:hypothetical protein
MNGNREFNQTNQAELAMPYEEGMQIVFDLLSGTIVISFRDKIAMLGPFEDQRTAIQAGEKYCRDRGWIDSEPTKRDDVVVKAYSLASVHDTNGGAAWECDLLLPIIGGANDASFSDRAIRR